MRGISYTAPGATSTYPATLERHDEGAVVERITGRAWSPGVAIADDRGILFPLRFVPDLITD